MKNINFTQNYYNAISNGYKELYHEEQIKKIKLVLNFIPRKGVILDLGAGDGVLNQFISKDVKLVSFDLSEELLKLNPNSNENKIQGNCENLPFNNNSIDFISTFTMLQDIPNPIKAIEEIKRVLKNNSKCIISYLILAENNILIYEKIKELFEIQQEINEQKDTILVLKKKN